MQRSGTTLLDKLLCNHLQLSVLSQPAPLLFTEIKRSFLDRFERRHDAFPLNDLFLEDDYTVDQFNDYLNDYRLGSGSLSKLFKARQRGQYTEFDQSRLESFFDRLDSVDLAGFLAALYSNFTHRAGADAFGGKETLCEEYLPYFLARGFKCILILRDPRDVLASLNYGRGSEYGGTAKATLFNLRNWRKSVAFALHLTANSNFLWLRYEDLVAAPLASLNRVAALLKVKPFLGHPFAGGIKNQEGEVWRGNSSHFDQDGISAASIGVYQRLLPRGVIRYAEAVCYPELRALGYPVSCELNEVPDIITSFSEPFEIRDTLRKRFSDPARIDEELQRFQLILNPVSTGRRFFVFEDLIDLLRRTLWT
jgi:sulfotransferase family protein